MVTVFSSFCRRTTVHDIWKGTERNLREFFQTIISFCSHALDTQKKTTKIMLQNSTRSLRFHQKIPKHSTTRLEKFIVFFYWRNYDHFYEYSERLFFPREISRAKHSKNSSRNWPFKFSIVVGISTGPDS
jgi:hypothetical protein